jgi:hypothetical protein
MGTFLAKNPVTTVPLTHVLKIGAKVRSNSALLTDAYTSPLRAQRGAAKRER